MADQTNPTQDDTQQNPPTDANPSGEPGDKGGKPETTTLTQSQVNALVGKARGEAREKALADLLADLGVAKVDELKTVVTQHKKAVEAQMSELEKAQQTLATLQADNANLSTRLADVQLRHAIESEANRQQFQDAADAYSLIDVAALTLGDDGTVKGAKEALEALAKAKPYLLKATEKPGAPLGTPARRTTTQPNSKPAASDDSGYTVRF